MSLHEAKILRRKDDAPPAPRLFRWFFCPSHEFVLLEICAQRQVQRTEAARPDGKVDSEEKYSWMEHKASGFKAHRDLVFEHLLTTDEVLLRLLAGRAEEDLEVLGEALIKVDDDIEDTVGLEGEITVPLVRGSRCIPCRFFAFKDDGCNKGTNCEFCHLCSGPEALKRMKRAHLARRKQEEALQKRIAKESSSSSSSSFWL
eukprot:s1178_g1.t2